MSAGEKQIDCDVIVVGAGIIGSACACLLARSGFRVILLEAGMRQLNSLKANDPRIFAISLASKTVLDKAGAWRRLPAENIGHYGKMHVWDEQGVGEINFSSADICQPALGYIISYRALTDALQETMLDTDNIRCLWSMTPTSVQFEEDRVNVATSDGLNYSARLIVAADGSNSAVRKLAGIKHVRHDYKQSALSCIAVSEYPHAAVARQRFLKRGPLAFLPMLEPNQSAIVWSSSPDHIQRLLDMDEASFNFELAEAFGNELGSIESSTERVVFPLSRAEAENYTKRRLALIGDSAHSIHPLAGQGANLGLLDAATLAEILIDCRDKGRDPGRHAVLRRYERWRKGENRNMMYLMDGFKYLFENQHQSVRWLRNFGLDAVDGLPPLKHAIMRRAMGLTGNLPGMAVNT